MYCSPFRFSSKNLNELHFNYVTCDKKCIKNNLHEKVFLKKGRRWDLILYRGGTREPVREENVNHWPARTDQSGF